MLTFNAEIFIIGVNPYVLLPDKVLQSVFAEAKKEKGAIPVRGTIDGHPYVQTLVKYSGLYRLYLNTPMRKAANKQVGDNIRVTIEFDPDERIIPVHPRLQKALDEAAKAKEVFEKLPPSRRKEIIRYINFLKNEETVDRNIERAIRFLSGNDRFVGRDKA